MPANAKWYLVCYDVRDAKRLRRVAKHLLGYGSRVQYSVYRCWLGPADLERLRWELTERLRPEDDAMFIPLCARCVDGLKVAHAASKPAAWPATPARHAIV